MQKETWWRRWTKDKRRTDCKEVMKKEIDAVVGMARDVRGKNFKKSRLCCPQGLQSIIIRSSQWSLTASTSASFARKGREKQKTSKSSWSLCSLKKLCNLKKKEKQFRYMRLPTDSGCTFSSSSLMRDSFPSFLFLSFSRRCIACYDQHLPPFFTCRETEIGHISFSGFWFTNSKGGLAKKTGKNYISFSSCIICTSKEEGKTKSNWGMDCLRNILRNDFLSAGHMKRHRVFISSQRSSSSTMKQTKRGQRKR